MKINLLIIATGKYTQFLPQFLESAEKHFLKGHEVHYCIFTDKIEEAALLALDCGLVRKFRVYKVEHKPWPHSTLKRFHFFLQYHAHLPNADYLFYCDVDSRFVAPIGEEILSNLVAVQHCGFVNERGTFETRPQSTAYMPKYSNDRYLGGGFLGGSSNLFWAFCETIAIRIDKDEENGITAIHHDESHWNKYVSESLVYPNILSPSYHYPENHPHIYGKWARQGVSFEPKILLLNKNHAEVRNA